MPGSAVSHYLALALLHSDALIKYKRAIVAALPAQILLDVFLDLDAPMSMQCL